jgi:hypothetical protein
MRTKRLGFVVIAVLLSLGGAVAPLAAQSLADVARKEQDRRKAIQKPSKVLTNEDLKPAPGPTVSTATAPAGSDTTPAAGNGGAAPATSQPSETTPDPSKDQAFWSGRAKELQTQLDRDQTFAVALQSQINALTTQYVNQGDPVQQAALANDRQKAVNELNRITKQVEDDKKAIASLQEEARRAGVPSGWLR